MNTLEEEKQKSVDKHDSLPAPLDERWLEGLMRFLLLLAGLAAPVYFPLTLPAILGVIGVVAAVMLLYGEKAEVVIIQVDGLYILLPCSRPFAKLWYPDDITLLQDLSPELPLPRERERESVCVFE